MLAGAPIAGRYDAVQPGHSINNLLVRKLLETPSAWCWETDVEASAVVAARRSAAV
jgi:UDP-3-O-[3-hydroxymyristoyl] N-acetylglucosamine deacetylase